MGPKFGRTAIIIVIGALFILFGITLLFSHFLGSLFYWLLRFIAVIFGILFPLLIIVGGILLLVNVRKKLPTQPKGQRLYRSTSNKKIAGVCGGIATYLGVEPATVRIIALIIGVICWYLAIPAYLIFWIVTPPDTRSFNTWT